MHEQTFLALAECSFRPQRLMLLKMTHSQTMPKDVSTPGTCAFILKSFGGCQKDVWEFWDVWAIRGPRMQRRGKSSMRRLIADIKDWNIPLVLYRAFITSHSLFMWSIFCNVIPHSPSYSPFRSFYSDSSSPLDYLWVLFSPNRNAPFLCVWASSGMDGYGFEYLMNNCWMSAMHNVPQFPFQPLDTDEGGKPGKGNARERERERE